jgi:hypothetical protein
VKNVVILTRYLKITFKETLLTTMKLLILHSSLSPVDRQQRIFVSKMT